MRDIKTSFMIPEEIWKAAKVKAAEEGISLGELIRNLLSDYLKKEGVLPGGKKGGR